MESLTSTSYAPRPARPADWSTHELARQPRAASGWCGRAEARLYAEAKKLAAAAWPSPVPSLPGADRAPSTPSPTPDGRGRGLAVPSRRRPDARFEGMPRWPRRPRHPRRPARAAGRHRETPNCGSPSARGAQRYLSGQGTFPDRLHVSGLAWRFLHEHSGCSGTGPLGHRGHDLARRPPTARWPAGRLRPLPAGRPRVTASPTPAVPHPATAAW